MDLTTTAASDARCDPDDVAEVMAAPASPSRLEIARLLAEEELDVSEIAHRLGASTATTSHHLGPHSWALTQLAAGSLLCSAETSSWQRARVAMEQEPMESISILSLLYARRMAVGERTRRRKQQMTAAILEAAEHAFATHGFESVTVEQVAEAADVAVGSIYNHFGSKEGLLLAVAEHALETDERYMDAAYDPSRSPIQQISAAAAWYFRFSRDHPELFRLLAFPLRPPRLLDGPAAEVAQRVAQRVDAQNARLAEAIRAGVESGVLRPVSPEDAAVFLWAAWSGVIALAWRPDGLGRSADEVEQLLALGAQLIGRGMLAEP